MRPAKTSSVARGSRRPSLRPLDEENPACCAKQAGTFGAVNGLTFRFESSDMSFGYINTPTYFALDEFHITNLLGVSELNETDIELYPNPVVNELEIRAPGAKISVLNAEGKVVLTCDHKEFSTLDLSAMEAGFYLVKLEKGTDSITRKIVKY